MTASEDSLKEVAESVSDTAAGSDVAALTPNASTTSLRKHVHGTDTDTSTASKRRQEKPSDLPITERRNWLIHQHYIKHELDACKALIKEQLMETNGLCEYALYVKGILLRKEGKIQESLETFQTCCIIESKNVEYLKQVARSLFLLGKHKVAVDVYKEASNHCVNDWEIFHNLGLCYTYMQDYDMAKHNLKMALNAHTNEHSFLSLAKVYLLEEELTMAVDLLKTAIECFPENPDLLTVLGSLYLKQGQSSQAFSMFGNALIFDSSNVDSILGAGSLMQQYGDYDVALTKYRIAAAQVPESPPLWNNIGMCFFGKKKYVAAISCLKRATYLAPFDWKPLYNLGLVHITMQQYSSAFHFLSAAVNLRPRIADIYMLLAVALTNLDDNTNAKSAYEKALRVDQYNVTIAVNYCIFLYNQGDEKSTSQAFGDLQRRINYHKLSNLDIDKDVLDTAMKLGSAIQIPDNVDHQPTTT